jgi:hypothetical protein
MASQEGLNPMELIGYTLYVLTLGSLSMGSCLQPMRVLFVGSKIIYISQGNIHKLFEF